MRERKESDDDVEPKQKKQKRQDGEYDCAIYLKFMYETKNLALASSGTYIASSIMHDRD